MASTRNIGDAVWADAGSDSRCANMPNSDPTTRSTTLPMTLRTTSSRVVAVRHRQVANMPDKILNWASIDRRRIRDRRHGLDRERPGVEQQHAFERLNGFLFRFEP